MFKHYNKLATAFIFAGLTLATAAYAANNGQPEVTIYNQQGSAPVTDIAYWINNNTGDIDCAGTQNQGVAIAAGTHQTIIQESDMSKKCQDAKVNTYVLHVHGNFVTGSWPYTAYIKSGSVCYATHNRSGLFFTKIDLTCN